MPALEEHEGKLVEPTVASGLSQNSAFRNSPLLLDALLLWMNLDVDKLPYTQQVLGKSGIQCLLQEMPPTTNDQHSYNGKRDHTLVCIHVLQL